MKGDDHHYGPALVDLRCAIGIPLVWEREPALDAALETTGFFNIRATVRGKIVADDRGGAYLQLTKLSGLQVRKPANEAAERAFFVHMVRTRNAYYGFGYRN